MDYTFIHLDYIKKIQSPTVWLRGLGGRGCQASGPKKQVVLLPPILLSPLYHLCCNSGPFSFYPNHRLLHTPIFMSKPKPRVQLSLTEKRFRAYFHSYNYTSSCWWKQDIWEKSSNCTSYTKLKMKRTCPKDFISVLLSWISGEPA